MYEWCYILHLKLLNIFLLILYFDYYYYMNVILIHIDVYMYEV